MSQSRNCDPDSRSLLGWRSLGQNQLSIASATPSLNLVIHIVVAILTAQTLVAAVHYSLRTISKIIRFLVMTLLVVLVVAAVAMMVSYLVVLQIADPEHNAAFPPDAMWSWVRHSMKQSRVVQVPLRSVRQLVCE
jgi:dolichyl-phosphate-mannose--protein O-mannosyl transferase